MAKKDPVQGLSADSNDKYEEEASARRLGKMRDVAGAIALPTALYALGKQNAKEDRIKNAEDKAKEKQLSEADRAEMRKMRDDMAKEKVNNPKITPRKKTEIFEEGMTPPKDSEMKKGGSVKSASARADGCAIRGKTRA